ncbi:MAG: globin-coupled sensor protein, partial [Proteobacteria bacterium]|nr:globin-coupled sensor protein [Pseudomonadota bacterium]
MSANDSLNDRLSFMELDAATQADIRAAKTTVMRALPGALDAFYEKIGGVPATRKFFSDPEHMRGAKSRQLGHWEAISSGKFDDAYVAAVTKVGEVHARIGLEPRWYIGGYALLLERLVEALVNDHWPKRFGRQSAGAERARRQIGGVVKATLLDMDYAISVYIEASERERLKAEAVREAAAKEQAEVVAALAAALGRLKDGDLTGPIAQTFPADYEKLRADFNAALDALADTMSQVLGGAQGIGAGTDEISQASDDLSRRTEQQAASLEETAAALDQITATVRRTAEGARQASGTVTRAKDEAVHSGEVVAKAVDAMGQIEKSSQQISQIIGVIDEIAFQTNL